ncbi:alkaline ceramidase [Xylogone sp. PMI_703]|nr:alkaline ceramidase [Xylogone sp. PMI_703]
MAFSLPSVRYPPARPGEGYWTPVTSTINWCEEDYYATLWSAEIVNTLTNLLFMALGVKGLRNCFKHDHDSVFVVSFIGYLLVGTGSFFFHSTLKYPMQLVDELSMIYTASLMCYATFSFSRPGLFRLALGVGLIGLSAFITLYYHYLQDPLFHQNAFAILTAIVLFRSMYVMEVNIRPSFKERSSAAKENKDSYTSTESERVTNIRRDEEIIKEMWIMVAVGLTIFLSGFGIWILDQKYCSNLRRWRREIGLPWGILLEGIGSYYYIVWAIWLRHCLNERQGEYSLNWPSIFSLPECIRTSPSQSQAASNGVPKSSKIRAQNGASREKRA